MGSSRSPAVADTDRAAPRIASMEKRRRKEVEEKPPQESTAQVLSSGDEAEDLTLIGTEKLKSPKLSALLQMPPVDKKTLKEQKKAAKRAMKAAKRAHKVEKKAKKAEKEAKLMMDAINNCKMKKR